MIDPKRIRGLADALDAIDQMGKYPLGGGNTSTGITMQTPPETPDSNILIFTVSRTPKWVVADGATYYDGAGYTAGAGIITMNNAPSQYIRYAI